MILSKDDLNKLEKRYRANLINSITGIKPANLIGTTSKLKQDNLAIFSSVVHLGSDPAHIGMVTRPQAPKMNDTYSNINETGYFTINSIEQSFIKKAHYTSARLEKEVSEFEVMKLKRAYVNNFFAPFVDASSIKIGLQHVESFDLPNGCILIIGEVEIVELSDSIIQSEGHLDWSLNEVVGITGLNSYYSMKKINSFPYAKRNAIPEFDV